MAVLLGVLGLVLVLAGASRPERVRHADAASYPVLVAAHGLPAGALLGAADVAATTVGGSLSGLPGLLRTPGEAVGRRLIVALPAGVPVLASLLAAPAALEAGHRLARLQVDAASLPPDLQAGQLIDVLAAVADSQSGDGRVLPVAEGVLVAVSGTSVTLDVDPLGAERLLWAESFAKALRLLARPPGETGGPPPEVTGLVAAGSEAAR